MATSKTIAKKPATTTKKTASKPAAKTASTKTSAKPAAKTASAKKPVTAKPVAKTTAAKKPAAPRAKPATKPGKTAPSPELRYKMVQEAAYFLAERNGFAGSSMDYWVTAEAQISEMLGKK